MKLQIQGEWIMGGLKRWLTERKANKYVMKTPEEEYAIYKRRLLSGESDISARAGLKHLKKKQLNEIVDLEGEI